MERDTEVSDEKVKPYMAYISYINHTVRMADGIRNHRIR